MDPKVGKSGPKGTKREPTGTKMEPKGAKRDAKGSRFGGLAKCENCAPCRRELNFDPHEVSQRASRNDAYLERVRKGLPRPSRRLPGGLKDLWRSLERPEDTVGPGACTKPLALASWLHV